MAKERSMALGRAEGDRQIKKAELAVEKQEGIDCSVEEVDGQIKKAELVAARDPKCLSHQRNPI
jgi:hypothetical protein